MFGKAFPSALLPVIRRFLGDLNGHTITFIDTITAFTQCSAIGSVHPSDPVIIKKDIGTLLAMIPKKTKYQRKPT